MRRISNLFKRLGIKVKVILIPLIVVFGREFPYGLFKVVNSHTYAVCMNVPYFGWRKNYVWKVFSLFILFKNPYGKFKLVTKEFKAAPYSKGDKPFGYYGSQPIKELVKLGPSNYYLKSGSPDKGRVYKVPKHLIGKTKAVIAKVNEANEKLNLPLVSEASFDFGETVPPTAPKPIKPRRKR